MQFRVLGLFFIAMTLGLIVALAGSQDHHSEVGDLDISKPWIKETPANAPVAGGFLILQNNGEKDDRLIKVDADISEMGEIHEMAMENDVMKMRKLEDGIVIPAGETLELKPGSFHLMFIKLKEQMTAGDKHKVTLTFEHAGKVEIDFDVKSHNMSH